MKSADNFLIIGGDSRQIYLSEYLKKLGKNVFIYGLAEKSLKCVNDLKATIVGCDVIIFPLPVSKDNKSVFSVVTMKESLEEILNCIGEEKLVFGGMVTKGMESKLKKNGAKVFDYYKREDVTLMNTVPTVQGILKEIFENIDYTVHSSRCAVFGYGRVAKITADVLRSLGADVTVCVRKGSDISLAQINGLKGCYICDFFKFSNDFDILINTVPSLVIDRKILENVNKNCLIIDVASAPFGTDFSTAFEFGIKALQCPSLPGKVAPKTAGEIIGNGIINIMKEEGYG